MCKNVYPSTIRNTCYLPSSGIWTIAQLKCVFYWKLIYLPHWQLQLHSAFHVRHQSLFPSFCWFAYILISAQLNFARAGSVIWTFQAPTNIYEQSHPLERSLPYRRQETKAKCWLHPSREEILKGIIAKSDSHLAVQYPEWPYIFIACFFLRFGPRNRGGSST